MAEFFWSATKFNTANYCDMRYYLRYIMKYQPIRISAYVKGSLLHEVIEHFFDHLGTPEEVASKSRKLKNKKYHDARSFTEHLKGLWGSIIAADNALRKKYEEEKSEDERKKMEPHIIRWAYNGEAYSLLHGLFTRLGPPLFNHLMKSGPPHLAEKPFSFKVGKEVFSGRLDDVRISETGEVQIIDYKSGRPWIGEMKLAHDPQLTLYNAGICALIRFDPDFRKLLGLDGKVEEFMAGQKYVSPSILEGFFMIESLAVDPEKVRSMPNVIYETRRTDQNFFELLKMANSVKKRAIRGDVYPERGKKCDDCDMKGHCDKQLEHVNTGKYYDKHDQGLLGFELPMFARKSRIGRLSVVPEKPKSQVQQPITKSERNIKEPQFRLRYPKPEDQPAQKT